METPQRYRNVRHCLRCGTPLQFTADREGKDRPVCPACGWVYYLNPVPAAACVVLNETGELLLVKRKFEPFPGEWALPSGYMEVYQTPEQCAVDELREETGLVAGAEEFLGYFSGPSPEYENIISFAFLMKVTGGRLQAGDDAAEARYVAFSELPRLCFASHRYFLELTRQHLQS
jgi:8-oxo-dGTP diphosphatase